jgi:hypothetical protein
MNAEHVQTPCKLHGSWAKWYEGVPAAAIIALALCRVAIDEMPVEHRVVQASNLMLQKKHSPAAIGFDDRLEPKLMIAHIFRYQLMAF